MWLSLNIILWEKYDFVSYLRTCLRVGFLQGTMAYKRQCVLWNQKGLDLFISSRILGNLLSTYKMGTIKLTSKVVKIM